MAKAQKRSNREVHKPRKTQAKAAVAPAASKNLVKLTETRSA